MPRKPFRDYYKALGLDAAASATEIRNAYRKLAMQLHPDRSSHDEDRMKAVNEAYGTLNDQDKKEVYDAKYRIEKARAARAGSEETAKLQGDRIRRQGTPPPRPAGQYTSPPPPPTWRTPPRPPRKPPTTPRRAPEPTPAPPNQPQPPFTQYDAWRLTSRPRRPPAQATPAASSLGASVLSLIGTGILMTVGVVVGWLLLCVACLAAGFLVIAIPGYLFLLLLGALGH